MIKNQRVFWSGQYLFPDTDDPGDEPDVGLLEGTVTFAPVWDAGVSGLLSDSQRSTYVKPFPIEIRDGQLMSNDDGTWIPGAKIPASIGGHPISWVARFDLSAGGEKITVRELRFTSSPDGEVHLHNVIPAEAIFPQLPPDIVKGDSVTNIYTQGQYVVFIVGDPPRTKQYVLAFPGTDEAIAAAEAAVVEFEQLRDAGVLAIEQTRTSAEAAIGQARDEVQGLKNDASTQAGIATTKAGEAGGFRDEAEGFKNDASTQAGIATTKAGEAGGFRDEAEGFKNDASTQAGIATTKAGEAQGFRNEAEGFKNTASTQAGIATTKAGEAQGFRNEAEGFKNQALAARLSWKGAWDSGTAYVERDVVSHGGSSWWAKQPSTGVEPAEGATWSLVASRGEKGEGITSAADLTGALTDQVDASGATVPDPNNEFATQYPLGTFVEEMVAAVNSFYSTLVNYAPLDHLHDGADISGALTAQVNVGEALFAPTGDAMEHMTVLQFAQAVFSEFGNYSLTNHKHPVTDLNMTGTPSASTFARGDGTWATPPNTTYSVPTQAEAEAGTATTARAFSAQRVRQAANAAITAREWTGTQAQYDALATKDPNTTYYVTE